MWAMIVKEFRQLRRDRRTLAMMIVMPVVLLVVFGYAASFDVSSVPTVAAGPAAGTVAARLGAPFDVVDRAAGEGRAWAQRQLRDGKAAVAVVTTGGAGGSLSAGRVSVLIDGSQLFTARAALTALASHGQPDLGTGQPGLGGSQPGQGGSQPGQGGSQPGQGAGQAAPSVTVLYNPGLKTADIMIPGLAGVILVFIGTIITSLGVVRERQSGTLEQLAVMPLRPRDVFLGKIVPYFVVAALDLAIVLAVGVALFGVPFRGSYAVFALGAVLFLFVTLGLGVLISSVSENQGQAIQLSVMAMLPQVLLSGLIFPLSSIAAGVRWISYLLPLTYFTEISRGVMLRAEPIVPLWQPLLFLVLLGTVTVTLATLRFRSFLAPALPRHQRAARSQAASTMPVSTGPAGPAPAGPGAAGAAPAGSRRGAAGEDGGSGPDTEAGRPQ
jgi:ABC-2 type transport system permease protein